MSQPLRHPGEYRGKIFDYSLIEKKNDKGDCAGLTLHIKVSADQVWLQPDGGGDLQWLDCAEWDAHGEGYIVLITKANKVNDTQISRLVKCAGWDGEFSSLVDKTWEPKPVRFDIQAHEYNGQTTFRINWINEYDSEPGVGGNVDADRARQLANQFGSAIRALVGNSERKSKPLPSGKPSAPRSKADHFDSEGTPF